MFTDTKTGVSHSSYTSQAMLLSLMVGAATGTPLTPYCNAPSWDRKGTDWEFSTDGTRIFEVEGQKVRCDARSVNHPDVQPLAPGETYVAGGRNTGWHLLTCREQVIDQGFVVPQEIAYPYDSWECFRFIEFVED